MSTARALPFVLSVLLGVASSAAAEDPSAWLQSAFRSHCVRCHGKGGKTEGKVNLLALQSHRDFESRPELLETLITVLEDRQMPPEDEPALPDTQRSGMLQRLRTTLQRALKSRSFEPTPIRRMNRFQYNNAVVDLLELDRDIFLLNERLIRRRQDYFLPDTRKMPAEVHITSRPLSKDIDGQRPEGFRGVAAFPQDKRAEHGYDNRADHLTLSPLLMESFLQLSQSIVESPDLNPRECRSWNRLFAPPGEPQPAAMEGRHEAENPGATRIAKVTKGRAAPQEMMGFGDQWSGNSQLFWLCPGKGAELVLSFEARKPGSGLRFGFTEAPDYGTFELQLDDRPIGKPVNLFGPRVDRTDQDVAVAIAVGRHTLRIKCVGKDEKSLRHFFGLDFVDITGQAPAPQVKQEVLSVDDAVRVRLRRLLRRAFRRPVDSEVLDRFTQFTQRQLAAGHSFEDTMRTVVGAVLGMPDFLYFYETAGPQGPTEQAVGRQPVDDFELASRLAQFLWSSIPDDTLLDLAEAKSLSDPKTLEEQIERMLNDRRSSRFCDNFPAQWLQLDRLITSIPDPEKFPYFYYNGYRTSMHMLSEPLLLFETIYIEDRSVVELLDPKFTWQSEMLAANYAGHAKAPRQVNVQVFKRVPLSDPRRGGVITNAAVMTMTSTPTRTQPITRGAWVNAVIFNDPPDPPPADVPPLPEADGEELAKLTIRERLAVHRKRADCAGCHNKIDPLGFALENFGPTGVWRDRYENGRKVDPSGVLFQQHSFDSVAEFKRLLLQEKRRFLRGFVAHLLSYALGRELGAADSPSLDRITAEALAGEDQMRVVLKKIAMSEPFRHKSVLSSVAAVEDAKQGMADSPTPNSPTSNSPTPNSPTPNSKELPQP